MRDTIFIYWDGAIVRQMKFEASATKQEIERFESGLGGRMLGKVIGEAR